MRKIGKIIFLVIVLCILGFALYKVAYLSENGDERKWDKKQERKNQESVIQSISTGKEVVASSSSNVILHEKFRGSFNSNDQIIVVNSDGEAYAVKSGSVIADGLYIQSDEKGYLARRLENERFSHYSS